MKKYTPVYFDTNYVTYKLGKQVMENEQRAEAESKAIFNKNFRTLYPMNETVLDKMAKYSEFPQELLNKLVKFFPDDDRDIFFDRYEQLHQIRLNAAKAREQYNN